MKRKHFILAFVAMLWSFSFSAYADDVIVVNSWAELKAALEANDGVQRSAARQRSTAMRTVSTASEETTEEETKTPIPNTPYYYEDFQTTKIRLGNDVVYDDALPIAKSNGTTLDLNGYTVSGSESAEHAYPFYNYGKFLVVDNSEAGTGAIYCGVKTGIKEDGVSINKEAVFVMTGGNIICTHDNEEDAAVVNYGIAYITGGTIEGANNAVLNQDDATMNILAGLISGDVVGTGINAAPGVYTVATIGYAKYASLDDAFTAATDGQTITLLRDATPTLTSQRDITKAAVIDLGGKTLTLNEDDLYFGTTTFKNGTIVVNPSVVASTAVFWMFEGQTLTFEDVDIVATGVTGTYLIGINGGTGSAVNLQNGSSIIIDNTEKAALIAVIADNGNGNSVTIQDSRIDVRNVDARLYLGGTNGSVTVENSVIDLNGVKEGFYLRAGQVLSVEGISTVDITLNSTEGCYGINKTDFTSAYTKAETATVNATIGELTAAAQIGTTKYLTLQAAIDAAVDGDEIVLKEDITEDVKITQKADVDLVINGDGKKFTGIMTVFGNGRQSGAETLTIKNVNFVAKNGADACILSPDHSVNNLYSYSHNVTVENCTFTDLDGDVNCAAIRQGDGGDKNWTVKNCTVDATMHSLLQVNNVAGKLVVDNCTVKSKNGLNLNACTNVELTNNRIETQGYAVRTGVSTGGNLGEAKTFVMENDILKSACDDGDAVIMFRASAVDANLSMTENVVSGTTHISGNTADTKISADANYWDGKNAPVASTDVFVNTYYTDEALTQLAGNAKGGNIIGYTDTYRIWSDSWGNARESFVVKVLDAEGKVMGTTSLNNKNDIIDGDVEVTWSINLKGESSDYWTMEWTTAPSIDNMPAKVQLWIDGVKTSEGPVQLNDPDNLEKIVAVVTDAEGKILSFQTSLATAIAAAQEGNVVASLTDITLAEVLTIEKAVTIDLNGKTVTGADGAVVFDVKAATTIKNGTVKGNKGGTSDGLINLSASLTMEGVTVETSKINAFRFKAGECTATLTDCNVTGAFKGYGGSTWVINSGTYKASSTAISDQLNGTASVSGGTFHYAIEEVDCAPGYKVVANTDGTYTVEYAPVCFVDTNNNGILDDGEVVYGSLEAVFNTIKEGDVYIVLTANTEISNQVDTDADAKYYLNTNVAEGVTVNFNFNYTGDWNCVQKMSVGKNVTLNVPYRLLAWTELDVYGTINAGYLYNMGAKVNVYEGAVVNVNTGEKTIQVKSGAVLTVNGTVNTSTLNVWAGESKLNVAGANAKVNASWIDIWDGTPSVALTDGATLDVESIKASRGGAIAVTDATLDATSIELGHNGESAGVLTESGESTITGEIKMTATGSTVASDGGLNVTTNIADHKVVFDEENKQYKVVPKDYVAQVGDVKYESVTEAINAAADGATVQLLAATISEYIAPWAGNSKHDTEKSITIVGAADYATTLTGGMYLGYDDSQCREHNIVVKGIVFQGKGLKVACQQNVTIEGNKFTNITEGQAIAVIGKDINSVVKNNVIESVSAAQGIELRNTLTAVVEGNTISGTGHNSLQITSQVGATASKATVLNNTLSDWGLEDEGRAMRINGIVTATINGNVMTHSTTAPEEFVKVTSATTLDASQNYWAGVNPITDGMFNTDMTADPASLLKSYYTDATKSNLIAISASPVMIGNTYYQSLADALAAAQDGETVTLLWNEGDPAIAMNGSVYGKNVTITGTATVDWSKGFLFVGRGGAGNGTVIFDGANLTSASDQASTGIHVSGREKGTDNKYDGTLVIKNSTIDLDYLINKGTMSLDNSTLTVKNGFSIGGRPASETESGVDATATISLANSSKVIVNNHNGMGLGYEALGVMKIDKTSTFEATQDFLVTAKGTMNVNGGTVKIVGTLTNKGTVYVTGEANLDATVEGGGWFYMNGVSLDADTKLLGAKVRFASGENTVDGATIDDGFFQVGIGAYNGVDANVDTESGVVVNVKNNAKIGSNGNTYAGWVGTGFYNTDIEKVAVMTDAKYVLNIDNSIAEFGYLHVSNDGELNVNGKQYTTNYNNSEYAFYAGDFIINGTANFTDTDVLALYTKVSCDNGTTTPGTLNINGTTEYEAERHNGAIDGTNFILYKTGVANVAEEATLHIGELSSIAADAVLNIAGTATALGTITNEGVINFTNDAATLTTPTADLTVNTDVADYKVAYIDGVYQLVAKEYVAQAGDVKYESLQEAIENVADNGTVTLLSDVTVTEAAHGQNALNHARAINFTLDLNGKKLSADTGNSVFRFNIAGSGATSDVTVTVKNGTVISGANTWCTLMASGISADVKAVMNLEDLTIENYKGGDFAVKAWANGVVNAKNVTINASYGGGFYALGGEIVLDNCTVNQKGLWTAPYLSMTVGVSDGGKMTVNSGTYSAVPVAAEDGYNQGTSHGSWCGGVMSSGGTLIINGGTFSNGNIGETASNPRELFTIGADADYGDNVAARLEINGGTFNSIGALTHCETIWGSETDAANTYMPTMDVVITDGDFKGVAGKIIGGCNPIDTPNPVEIAISGGVYVAATHALDNSYLADEYVIAKLDDTTDTVVEATVKVNDTYYATLEAGLKALTDDATLTLLENITVTEAWDCRNNGAKVAAANVTIDGNGKTLTLTGNVDDRNWDAVFRFEGDNATVKNLTIDASEATGIQRGITAKLSITVDNCTIIGNGTTAKRAIIFGEGAGTALANVEATVTNSTFRNWTLGVSDNQSGKDAKSVTVSGNTFENASVLVSASENVTFDKNTLVGGYVNITSYTNKAELVVYALENKLDEELENVITVNPSHISAQGGFCIPVAEVGGAYCLTLAGAISKANGATVTVLDDIKLSEAVEVTTAAVLNLNDNSITPTTDATMTGGLFRLLDGADLTITGEGEISNNGNEKVYAAVSVLGNNAKLTVNGGNLTGHYYGIAGNGYKTGTQVTINGGVIAGNSTDCLGIYHPQNGTLTVTDGEITGATGIYFKGGKLDIQGGTIKGTGADVDYVYNGSGCVATGDALVIENAAANGYAAIESVSITGGTFISENAAPIASYAPEASDALVEFIGEGCNAQFNNNNIDESLLVIGYQLKDEDGDGYYGVKYTYHRESMTIVDGAYTEFVNETELSVGTLTYERTLPAAGNWYPLYVPFETPVKTLKDLGYEVAFFYDVHFEVLADGVINPESAPDVHLIKINDETATLKANFPYVIRASQSADLSLVLEFNNATLFSTATMNSVESGSTINRFIFAGTYKKATPEGLTGVAKVPCYAITNSGTFKQMGETAELAPFRVYMSIIAKDGSPVILNEVAAESIRMRVIGEENEDGTTTIYDVEADEQTVDYIYDLQGRRVLDPQKGGLYIVNGKKVIF